MASHDPAPHVAPACHKRFIHGEPICMLVGVVQPKCSRVPFSDQRRFALGNCQRDSRRCA